MKRYLNILLIAVILFSCDKIPDKIVEPVQNGFRAEFVSKPDTVKKSQGFLEYSVKINSQQPVARVWCNIYDINKVYEKIKENISLTASGNNIFSAKDQIAEKTPSGRYQVEIFASDETGYSKQVAEFIFFYNSGIANQPPVLSEISLPAKLKRNEDFTLKVKVTDINGLNDISRVYFTMMDPSNIENIPDGLDLSLISPAIDENNGYYQIKKSFNSNALLGKWTFKVYAIDKKGNKSNVLVQTLELE